jgi:hypothetical protein
VDMLHSALAACALHTVPDIHCQLSQFEASVSLALSAHLISDYTVACSIFHNCVSTAGW